MQKISKLKLKNFKFFYGEKEIDFECKNVLIYGENGSGKSSIYWALYTFMQSVFKTNIREVKKYFDHNSEQSLINRFAEDDCENGIIVEFEDDEKSKTTKEISNDIINTRKDPLVISAAQASDFINYKLLSKLYDFKNSKHIDLFDLFEDEILMFINFREKLVKHDDSDGTANASDWWKYIAAGMNPRPKMHQKPYKNFVSAVEKFNEELKFYLEKITESVNEYLKKFKQDIKVSFRFEYGEYDRFAPGSTTKRIHETTSPKIILDVKFEHENLDEEKRDVFRPQSFLNEARLTTIALAIRFAIFDEKLTTEGLKVDAPKILILDDLLLSLDMSNRDSVLELIINEFKNVQILLMTHDKSFFNLARRRIELENCENDWIYKEIYQGETEEGIPEPCIPDNKDYLSQAQKYLKEFDYPASANYLRKEAERILKHLLPENMKVYVKDDEGTKPVQLDNLIENFKKHYRVFCKDDGEFKKEFKAFKKLKEHKDFLLNPLSHDNIDTAIYKQELLSTIELLETLGNLDYKRLISICGEDEVFIFLKEIDSVGEDWIYKLQLKEHLCAFKKLDGTWCLNNPVCENTARKRISDRFKEGISDENNKLNKNYDRIRYQLNIKNSQEEKDLFEIIFTSDDKNLKELVSKLI